MALESPRSLGKPILSAALPQERGKKGSIKRISQFGAGVAGAGGSTGKLLFSPRRFHCHYSLSLVTTVLGKAGEGRGNRKTLKLGKEDEKGMLFCLLLLVISLWRGEE